MGRANVRVRPHDVSGFIIVACDNLPTNIPQQISLGRLLTER
jgi:hypothetical protein